MVTAKFSLIMTVVLIQLPCFAIEISENRVGRFYELGGSTEGKPIFLQKIRRTTNADGRGTVDSTIEDASGKVVMTEHAVLQGATVLSQRVEQLQIGKTYELEIKEGKATFQTFDLKDGKQVEECRSSVDVKTPSITGPATEPFLKEYFAREPSAKTVTANFGIFELQKFVSFEFRKTETLDEGRLVKIRLRPASFWISILVAPIDMEFEGGSYRLLRYKGRTPVRKLIDGEWKPLEAEIIYSEK